MTKKKFLIFALIFAWFGKDGQGQNPPASVTINQSRVNGGISGDCLKVNTNSTLGQQGCSAGTVTSVSGTTNEIDVATGTTTPVISAAAAILNDTIAACSDAGASDTYACSTPVAIPYVTNGRYRFKANTANTGAATINFNAQGAKTIVKVAGGITTALADNDIRAGQVVDLVYDGTNMQMQSTLGNAGGSSAGSTGCVQLTDGVMAFICDSIFVVNTTAHLVEIGGAPITPFGGLYVGPDESALPALIQGYSPPTYGGTQFVTVSPHNGTNNANGVSIESYAGTGLYGVILGSTGVGNNATGLEYDVYAGDEGQFLQTFFALNSANGHALPNIYSYAAYAPQLGGGSVVTNVSYWSGALGDSATNNYAFWADETGVFRIKADNTFDSVYQAIPALYNPQFTKYTPGALNFERIQEYWSANVAILSTINGGTGTLRNILIDGAEVDLGTASHLVNIPAASFLFNGLTCAVAAGAIACS